MHVTVQGGSTNGAIYRPYLEVEYAEVYSTDLGKGKMVPVGYTQIFFAVGKFCFAKLDIISVGP